MKAKVKLSEGQVLRLEKSRSEGFMGETDITEYSIVDAAGNVVGSVEFTDHTAVKGFRRTCTMVQKDKQGKTVVQESWRP